MWQCGDWGERKRGRRLHCPERLWGDQWQSDGAADHDQRLQDCLSLQGHCCHPLLPICQTRQEGQGGGEGYLSNYFCHLICHPATWPEANPSTATCHCSICIFLVCWLSMLHLCTLFLVLSSVLLDKRSFQKKLSSSMAKPLNSLPSFPDDRVHLNISRTHRLKKKKTFILNKNTKYNLCISCRCPRCNMRCLQRKLLHINIVLTLIK